MKGESGLKNTWKIATSLLALSLALAGCSAEPINEDSTNKAEVESEQVVSKQAVKKEEKMQETNEEEKTKEPKKEAIPIKKGETYTVEDFAEVTLVNTIFSKTIEPPNPDSYYTYYEAKEEGTTYLDTTIVLKSLLTSGRSADEFAQVEILFDDKYEYRTFATIEERGGSDFTYTSITAIEPLKNGTLHFLAEVPEEVANGSEPLVVTITLNGQSFEYHIR